MIVALLGSLLAILLVTGGGGYELIATNIDHFETGIREQVTDEARKAQALEIVAQARGELPGRQEGVHVALDRLHAADTAYDATMEQYTEAIDGLNDAFKDVDLWLLGLRFALKDTLTAPEWEKTLLVVEAESGEQQENIDEAIEKSEARLRKQVERYEERFGPLPEQ